VFVAPVRFGGAALGWLSFGVGAGDAAVGAGLVVFAVSFACCRGAAGGGGEWWAGWSACCTGFAPASVACLGLFCSAWCERFLLLHGPARVTDFVVAFVSAAGCVGPAWCYVGAAAHLVFLCLACASLRARSVSRRACLRSSVAALTRPASVGASGRLLLRLLV
jgi:hypothetical protein